MTSDLEMTEIAKKFLTGLRTADRTILHSIITEDAVWSMPGSSSISGEARGIDAIHHRAQTIVAQGMKFEPKHLLMGRHGVAASLHNTARHGGMDFDMHLATVMTICDGKIIALDTYMSDLPMLNTFFVTR
jgi:ketosteroid isomerase-like protein